MCEFAATFRRNSLRSAVRDKSSASTNSIRISVALCVSLTHFGLNLSQSRSPAQFLPQRRGLCFRRCAGQQLLIDGAVFFFAGMPPRRNPADRAAGSTAPARRRKAAQTKRRLFSSAQSVFFLFCSAAVPALSARSRTASNASASDRAASAASDRVRNAVSRRSSSADSTPHSRRI